MTPDCESVREELGELVAAGLAASPALAAHLSGCAGCRAHLAALRELQVALLEDVPPVAPPASLKGQVLAAARARAAPPRPALLSAPDQAPRRWWPLALSAAVISGVLALGTVLTPPRAVASALPDPAVVVASAGGLLVASNDREGTLSVIRRDRVTATVPSGGAQAAWFTGGVRLGDRIFLADAANDRVLEVQTDPLRVSRVHPVPGGVAGLSASAGPQGGGVYFKTVRGGVGRLGSGQDDEAQITVAPADGLPLADVMDGVLLSGGTLFVTHHLSGEVCLLDPQTLRVLKRVVVGGAPVDLAPEAGGTVLALDVTGRLLRLSASGQVVRSWPLPGHPDKLGVNGSVALVTDRAGQLTRIDLRSGAVEPLPLAHPMDVIALPDGTFVVAEGGGGGGGGGGSGAGGGVRVLDGALNTTWQLQDPPSGGSSGGAGPR